VEGDENKGFEVKKKLFLFCLQLSKAAMVENNGSGHLKN